MCSHLASWINFQCHEILKACILRPLLIPTNPLRYECPAGQPVLSGTNDRSRITFRPLMTLLFVCRSTLVAASERRSILMFDPLTHKMHKAKTNAHDDCVNVVK